MRELSLNVLDVAQNSISAGASLIGVTVRQDALAASLIVIISDNGKGMSPEQLLQVQDPFFTTRTTRKVGLGVPFFKMAAEMTGGRFFIRSQVGEGTTVRAEFRTHHIDMVPLGDMAETMLLLITTNPQLDFTYTHQKNSASFTLDTRELREILGEDVSLATPEVTAWLRDYLAEQTAALDGQA